MDKGIPVEYCPGSGKYANLFGVSLSNADGLAYTMRWVCGKAWDCNHKSVWTEIFGYPGYQIVASHQLLQRGVR